MGATYNCTNINCNFPGKGPFEMTFNTESIIDINNLATVFCPFCKKPMVTSDLLSGLDKSAVNSEKAQSPS
jgi:hypothetical protein